MYKRQPETASQFDFTQYDYVVDAIDTVTGKLELIEQATKAGTRIISCMGAGNKIHADKLEAVSYTHLDVYKRQVQRRAHDAAL